MAESYKKYIEITILVVIGILIIYYAFYIFGLVTITISDNLFKTSYLNSIGMNSSQYWKYPLIGLVDSIIITLPITIDIIRLTLMI